MEQAEILLVDDELAILQMMTAVLRKEGFSKIDTAADGRSAVAACAAKTYDIVLLDVMLPDRSGIEIAPDIRRTTNAPILFLTARTSDYDKLSGFAVGGDDYIVKPFNPIEVVARMRAQLRRHLNSAKSAPAAEPVGTVYDYGRFRIDEAAGTLTVDGTETNCPALVFQLLLFFCKHPNRIFGKSELYERVWGAHSYSDDNTVMVHIHRIRERIERDPSKPALLVNVRGMGYKLCAPARESGA